MADRQLRRSPWNEAVLCSRAFARWGRDLAMGQVAPRDADPTWHLRGPDFEAVAAVRAVPPEGDVASQLERLVPSHGLYRRLRTGLARYRRLAAQGGWNTTLAGPRLGRGAEGERVVALRSRLHREGDLRPDASVLDRQYDEVLADAVRRFQRRHGLLVDGIAGPRTFAALDIPVADRIAQLRRAMERLRWMPRALGDHYVLVNTAGFELTVVEGERTILGMRVVVGTPDQATPSFTAMLRSLVINPYWNVPARIASDKLLPRERRNPGYLAAHGFRVLDPRTGQWRTPDATSLAEVQASDRTSTPRLRQELGPANLMGRLSFILPERLRHLPARYPDRSLFAHEVRASSEGCVRIERAMALALHTLRREPEWTEDRIQGEIDALRHGSWLCPSDPRVRGVSPELGGRGGACALPAGPLWTRADAGEALSLRENERPHRP